MLINHILAGGSVCRLGERERERAHCERSSGMTVARTYFSLIIIRGKTGSQCIGSSC